MSPTLAPTVVFVGGSWCRPCKAFLPVVRAVCEARGARLEVFSVDGRSAPGGPEDLPRPDVAWRVTAVPTLIVLDASGRELRRSSGGAMSQAALTAWLQSGGL